MQLQSWRRVFQPQRNIVHRFIAYLMVLSILPLLALGFASFEISRSTLQAQAQRHLTQLLHERKRYVDLQTEQIEDLIANISGVEAITTGLATPYDPADNYARLSMQARIGYILNGYVNIKGLVSIDIFSRSGAQFHVGDTLDVRNLRTDVLDDLRRRSAMSTRPVYWAGIIDNVNGNSKHAKVVAAARQIYGFQTETSEQVPLGLLVVNYSVDYLKEQFGAAAAEPAMQLALIDGSGRLVYHSDAASIATPLDPALVERMQGEAGSFLWEGGGAPTLVSYIRSQPSGWPLAGFVSFAATNAQAAVIAKATALVMLLCLVIVAVAAVSYSRQVVAPLRQITSRFKQLRQDRTQAQEHLPVRGEDDVAELTGWFNAFLDVLREQDRAERALQASEARFRTIFEDAGIGMAVIGRDARFVLVNRTLQEMLGYSEGELLGQSFEQLIHPAGRDTAATQPRPKFAGSAHSRRFEAHLVRKDGQALRARVTEALLPEAMREGDHVIAAVEDITLQEQAEADRRARVAAEAANEAKSLFLAKMSHDLRTPLNAVLGYAQLLRRDKDMNERQLVALNTIQSSGEHLLMLINDILDLSKIEAGKLELFSDGVVLMAFLNSIVNTMRVKADEKGLAFRFDASPDLPPVVRCDDRRLRQVLLNLLDNAVKFTDQGEVTLRVAPQPQTAAQSARLLFEVQDTGVGIAPPQLAGSFEPFEQGGDTRRRSLGTGLGLAISRQLVRLMGGNIELDSALGRGSRFWFTLDLPVDEAREQPLPAATDRHVSGYLGARRRVLVVDDTPENRELVLDFLGVLGFDLCTAENGQEGLDKAHALQPDLILMDIVMPVLDGLEAIRRLRRRPGGERVPVIAVSANATTSDRAQSLAAGANAVLPKPIDFGVLIQQMGTLLRLSWVHEPPDGDGAGVPEAANALVPPPADELEALHRIARSGNMRAIHERADHISALGARYQPFADKLHRLASGFQTKGLLRLIEEHLATP